MPVTRSKRADRETWRRPLQAVHISSRRGSELVWLLVASLIVTGGLWLVFQAKIRRLAASAGPAPINLHEVDHATDLMPALKIYPVPADREFAARKISDFLSDNQNAIPNVGALSRIRVKERLIMSNPKLDSFRKRVVAPLADADASIPLLTSAQVSQLKSGFSVRSLAGFRSSFWLWTALFFMAFYAVHLAWRVRGFDGEQGVLPALHILTGIGLILMISLRDPLRDTLSFANFSQGVIAGCIVLGVLSFVDFERAFGDLSFVPLLGSLGLSLALIFFGTGPGTSDAKVNLLGTQPIEAIKILLVFFLAGYFARNWEFLRELKEKGPLFGRLAGLIEVPRLEYVAPVLVSIGIVLLFFFLQKDLGPALVFSCVFLTLYAVARKRVLLAALGLLGLISGFVIGYRFGHPQTVSDRVQMWLSPWDNTVHGGDQVVHSLWAMATGGFFGTGLGLGQPSVIPAGHTDLIVAVLGEEWGFLGVLAVFLLYGLLLFLAFRIVMRTTRDYNFFLALGLAMLTALQILLITGGILDLVPLSGVATPFLSYGRTSMIANFALFAILLSISRKARTATDHTDPFRIPVYWAGGVVAALTIIVVSKAAIIQTLRADATVGSGSLVIQADGVRRYQYNPLLTEIARSIPRGTIFDRNGIPLATSNWDELEQNRKQYALLGIDIDQACNKQETRHYPLGTDTFHLLGDLRTHLNWSASNSSLQERDSAVQLQGYDDRARIVEVKDYKTGKPTYAVKYDYRELLPLLRHQYEPDNPQVKKILTRNRDVRMSIDARLQERAAQILRDQLKKVGQDRGSLVVMDSATGDLLASVNEPQPALNLPLNSTGGGPLLDRARYGLYPPGSTFKVVTAIAALRVSPELANQTYQCIRLPDGRAGNYVGHSKRPVRDDVQDRNPHGTLNMERAITVSCNAYFAQLGTYKVGPQALLDTAKLLGISVANPPDAATLRPIMPQASYGQGQVVVSPFQMARVAATIAGGGSMPFGRWVIDAQNSRMQAPQLILPPRVDAMLARDMRLVVTSGTGRRVNTAVVPIAGKTGTAELADAPSHAWFIGFAPFDVPNARPIAFAMLVENGQYGGTAAAPMAVDLVAAAQSLGMLQKGAHE